MADTTREPITTHVLDSTTGLPAKSIPVTLTLLAHQDTINVPTFTALTSTDGRISQWATVSGRSLRQFLPKIAHVIHSDGRTLSDKLVWSLRFETEAYWGAGKTFYPQVEVRFFTDVKDTLDGTGHWHVPVLLGPWSYTTYKGS